MLRRSSTWGSGAAIGTPLASTSMPAGAPGSFTTASGPMGGAAESAGELVFAVRDEAGASYEVVVPIEGNDGENRVASKVRGALDRELPRGWRVERDDGEDVLVKRRWGRPLFEVSLVSSTVKDVRINFDRE